MGKELIGGLLQIGIGVKNMPIARKWYADHLHFDTVALEEKSITHLMTAYTGGQGHERHASVVMNMAGAGGLEVWQYLSRKPKFPQYPITLGDLGIFASILGSAIPETLYNRLQDISWKSAYYKKEDTFFFCDPYGNYFQVIKDGRSAKSFNCGVVGAIIGCSDIQQSINFYRDMLGYEIVNRSEESVDGHFEGIPSGKRHFKQATLKKSKGLIKGFSNFLGESIIQLVEAVNCQPKKIYADRYWGDPGYIHLCYDVADMDALKEHCKVHGYSFTVDSNETENGQSFEMGKVTSRVTYIDDPDGTAIEFVETHKLPIIAGFAINLSRTNKKRKDVPNWVLRLMRLRKVK